MKMSAWLADQIIQLFFFKKTFSTVIDERATWFEKTKTTIRRVEGSHSVHLENAPLVAGEVCAWILAQDVVEVARL